MLLLIVASIFLIISPSHGFHIEPRVINGEWSTREYPFFVQLRGAFKCGGTLLSDRWIVTAAHCLAPGKKVMAFFGIDAAGEFQAQVAIPTANHYIFRTFENRTYSNDIALLELPIPITFTAHIQPAVPAPVLNTLHAGSRTVVAIGTGRTQIDQKATDIRLREAYFNTMSSKECVAQVHSHHVDPYAVICANANYARGQSIHMGDSGGPLLLASNDNLIGVTSVYRCFADSEHVKLQVFTNIPFYYEWIEDLTGLTMPKRNGRQAFD